MAHPTLRKDIEARMGTKYSTPQDGVNIANFTKGHAIGSVSFLSCLGALLIRRHLGKKDGQINHLGTMGHFSGVSDLLTDELITQFVSTATPRQDGAKDTLVFYKPDTPDGGRLFRSQNTRNKILERFHSRGFNLDSLNVFDFIFPTSPKNPSQGILQDLRSLIVRPTSLELSETPSHVIISDSLGSIPPNFKLPLS